MRQLAAPRAIAVAAAAVPLRNAAAGRRSENANVHRAAGMRRGANSGEGAAATASSHHAVMRTLRTGRIGETGIAEHGERLAAAAAEVDLAPVARPARFRHPRRAAIGVERFGRFPDLAQRSVAHVLERQRRDGGSRRTWEHRAVRRDRHERVAPAVHARFRKFLEVVRKDVDDFHLLASVRALPRRPPRRGEPARASASARRGSYRPIRRTACWPAPSGARRAARPARSSPRSGRDWHGAARS